MQNPPRYKIPESVLVVIHSPDLEVLLIERADRPGYWQSVTGSRDAPDEPLADTARREVWEETGIALVDAVPGTLFAPHEVPLRNLRDWGLSNVYEIYPVWRHRYAPGVTRNTEHVFGLQVPRGIPVTLAPREHLNHVWLPWREAADRCFSPSNAEAILQLPRHAGKEPCAVKPAQAAGDDASRARIEN
ncbi:dihydroneopterin triphosphate pyrophosphatase [Noviherbaspirillum humi]|uniref:Dihydroneopterin triphosphate pyrophosphatase n=1 Tax=Noviherbaspirillum humi TaxID=1688639 RepID=A0A239CLX9_9BURK|nr:dihydroneopterin triphosphate diphosphatase [Noviherbaspirillum humi]SNS21155.1 dihydroneopterin triphosphate pyrophosphatase [Noviherbaspirillum humi]